MSFHVYRATEFNHAHENKVFDKLHDLLKSQWAERDEPFYLLGNFFVDGSEIDALVIKRNAIIVIDFKDYGGNLNFSENGRWLINGCEVRGGNKRNPFQQIRDNKYQLLNFLKKLEFLSNPNLSHIAGLCLFHQSIKFDENQLPHNLSRWFHITDMNTAIRMVNAIVSSEINLSDKDFELLLTKLDIPPYFPDGKAVEVIFDDVKDIEINSQLNTQQTKALVAIKDWLKSTKTKVFSLSGAFYTGKTKLLKFAEQHIIQQGKSPIYLAPNARIANLYNTRGLSDVKSIYSWLYASRYEIKNEKAVYSINLDSLIDSEKDILIFLNSHLLGDEYFETDTTIYGSGFVLQDLLNTLLGKPIENTNIQSSLELKNLPKILLVGDPYQLTRGAKDKSLLCCKVFKQRNIEYEEIELNAQDRDVDAPIERLDFQKTIIEEIKSNKFIQLPICKQDKIKTINKGQNTEQIAKYLLQWPKKTFYLCAKNETAHRVNTAIRHKYLKTNNDSTLIIGDIVDLHNRTLKLNSNQLEDTKIELINAGRFDKVIWADNNIDLHNRTLKLNSNQFEDTEIEWINAGRFGKVISVDNNIDTKSQSLKGRNTPVLVNFSTAVIEFGNDKAEILYLPDYLFAEKPELTQDQMIALKIWAREEADQKLTDEKVKLNELKNKDKEKYELAKEVYNKKHSELMMNSAFTNAARLRFGYALTVHRAQNYNPMPQVILDGQSAHDTENPATDSYFRWLYTATVCTSDSLQILNYPTLTPLSKAYWDSSSARLLPIIFKPKLYYQQNRLPTNKEMSIPLPNGFSNPEPQLYVLFLTVYDLISETDWDIKSITQHNYKERYLFSCDDGKVELDLNYNGKYEVSIGIAKAIEGASELATHIKQQLCNTPPIFKEKNIEDAESIFSDHLAKQNWRVISVDEKNYKLFVIIENYLGKANIELNVPSDSSISQKGMISSIKVQQADSKEVLEQFEKDFING